MNQSHHVRTLEEGEDEDGDRGRRARQARPRWTSSIPAPSTSGSPASESKRPARHGPYEESGYTRRESSPGSAGSLGRDCGGAGEEGSPTNGAGREVLLRRRRGGGGAAVGGSDAGSAGGESRRGGRARISRRGLLRGGAGSAGGESRWGEGVRGFRGVGC
jgi:hypothetical protein